MIIDQLPSVGTPALTDETVTEQGQNLFKVTWQRLLNLFKGNTTLSELTNDAGFVDQAGAAAAAPVQSVNGMTGAVVVPSAPLSDDNPQPLGTATPGTSTNVSRADHVHAMPSADEVGAMSTWELLWTNASPSSDFAAQTISLSLSDYDQIQIWFRPIASETDEFFAFAEVGSRIRMAFPRYTIERRLVDVTTTGVEFFPAYYLTSYGGSSESLLNSYLVPVKIYGIKGVNS